MSATGGSIESITWGGREFPVTADADVNRKLGGFENTSEANGNGTARQIKARSLPSLSGIVTECDDSRGDHEFMQAIADSSEYSVVAVTYADGSVYQGSMQVEGELSHSNQSATLSYDAKGEGQLTRQ